MRNLRTRRFFTAAGATVLAIASLTVHSLASSPAAAPAPTGIAVVELFTSQGCSSCPPAERVVSELNTATATDHRPVFTLAFHVDYWDRLGWRDVFSNSAFSQRQYDYTRPLRLDQVYTPQMIVNGREQFVGSDKARADAAVETALETPAAVPVTVSAVTREGDGYILRFTAPAAASGQVLNAAVVEQGLSTEVKRGENAGLTMRQPSVVRWFTSITAATAGSVKIPALSGVQADRATVVAYVQRTADGAVLGAGSVRLP